MAEACGALAPHVPPSLRRSLLLSMLQQMLEDSSEEVRAAAVRSLGVVAGFIQDADKYQSSESLLFSTLEDTSERVLEALRQIFLPSLATWALSVGRLETSLLVALVDRVEKAVDPTQSGGAGSPLAGVRLTDPSLFTLLMGILTDLLPVAFSSFLLSSPFAADDAGNWLIWNAHTHTQLFNGPLPGLSG